MIPTIWETTPGERMRVFLLPGFGASVSVVEQARQKLIKLEYLPMFVYRTICIYMADIAKS